MYFPQSLLVLVCLYKCVFADPYTISLGDIHTYAVSVVGQCIFKDSTLLGQIFNHPLDNFYSSHRNYVICRITLYGNISSDSP